MSSGSSARPGAAGRLSHPNILAIYEVFEVDHLPWLAAELVDGRALSTEIRDTGALPLETVLRHAEGLADALALAHSKGVLHRDIKPSNVLVDKEGRARLTDFGLAEHYNPGNGCRGTRPPRRASRRHRPGAVVGTPATSHRSRRWAGRSIARSDIFSLGAVLYEMCTGRPAFPHRKRATASMRSCTANRRPSPG